MSDLRGPMVEEVIVRLIAAGATLYEWRCTPAALAELVLGRLFVEGVTSDAAVAASLTIEQLTDHVAIRLPAMPEPIEQRRSGTAGVAVPTPGQFAELFRALFAAVEARHGAGGMHAAALATTARIVLQAEDVGRHNAVDKVIGMALLSGTEPAGHGLLISARISGEIARKAARSGVSWLASRSIPTTLAVRIAHAAGLPLIGRAAGKHAFIYT